MTLIKVAYINFSRSSVAGVEDLCIQQRHTMLYKRALSKHAGVHYVFRNSVSFNDQLKGVIITARNFSKLHFLWFILRYAASNNIRMVVIHNLSDFMYTPFLKVFAGLKVVMQHHGEVTYRHKKALLMPLADRFVDAYFFHGIGNALPFANSRCIDLKKVKEVPEGTIDFKAAHFPNTRPRQAIFIGRLDDNKNLITLLKALAVLRPVDLQLKVYYSEAGMYTALNAYCLENNISHLVKFMGKVAASEIETALNESDIFISCSKYEAGGYSLIEALACGVYPIVSSIAPFDFLLRDLEFKRQFDPLSVNELTECLRYALSLEINDDVRNSIRVYFEDYVSPEAVATTILQGLSGLHTS